MRLVYVVRQSFVLLLIWMPEKILKWHFICLCADKRINILMFAFLFLFESIRKEIKIVWTGKRNPEFPFNTDLKIIIIKKCAFFFVFSTLFSWNWKFWLRKSLKEGKLVEKWSSSLFRSSLFFSGLSCEKLLSKN